MVSQLRVGLPARLFGVLSIGLLMGALGCADGRLWAQEEGKKAYDVKLTPDQLYSFESLQYRGDYLQFTAPKGQMALGLIDDSPTVVILFATGDFKLSSPPEFEEKMKQAFGAYPATGQFSRAYIRIRPKDYEAMAKDAKLTKIQDEALFNKAQEVYKEKFFGSYHAGDKATLPPEHSIFVDFETESFGQVIIEDGFWLRAIRLQPYKSVYPRGFEKPAKKKP